MMSTCPAYLGLVIFDVRAAAAADNVSAGESAAGGQGSTTTALLRSDLLIFCPSNFTASVRLAAPPTSVDTPYTSVTAIQPTVLNCRMNNSRDIRES